MSERQLREAFDRLNPSEAAKQRMLDAILAANDSGTVPTVTPPPPTAALLQLQPPLPVPPQPLTQAMPPMPRRRKPSSFSQYLLPVAACLILLAGVGALSLSGVLDGLLGAAPTGAAQPGGASGTGDPAPTGQPQAQPPASQEPPSITVVVAPSEPPEVVVTSDSPVVVQITPREPDATVDAVAPTINIEAPSASMPTPSMMEPAMPTLSAPGRDGRPLLPRDIGVVLAGAVIPLLTLAILLFWRQYSHRTKSRGKKSK